MQNSIPENSGFSESALKHLYSMLGNPPIVTNVQYRALEQGVGLGQSMLVVSPTSTGKTLIGLWAIQSGLERSNNIVYLVTHRALAKQKFEEFSDSLCSEFIFATEIVLATGDQISDGNKDNPPNPLGARLLVATYEKYLALLSASGLPESMSGTIIICDEVQLIGDETRGKNVEILLTLLKNSGWSQLVALSAVLREKDAIDLANWLDVKLIFESDREKHLTYEYWTKEGIHSVLTDEPNNLQKRNLPIPSSSLDASAILESVLQRKGVELPIIVFCMKKAALTQLAEKYLQNRGLHQVSSLQLSLDFDELPLTITNEFLSRAHSARITVHSSDLTEEERNIVEKKIKNKSVDVVFATSTLAAGVNFPFSTAIFSSYARWDSTTRGLKPIDAAEFHNMAGRVGRMGFGNENGRVIFFEDPQLGVRLKNNYLDISSLPKIKPQIDISNSEQSILQLISTGLTDSRHTITKLICNSFSGLWEEDNNLRSFEKWPDIINKTIDGLVEDGLIAESSIGKLTPTPIGKSIGNSGITPRSAMYILKYIVNKIDELIDLLPTNSSNGDLDKLAFLLFSACYSSPEFVPMNGLKPCRYLPWPLSNKIYYDASRIASSLSETVWQANLSAINSSKFALDWISGNDLYSIEKNVPSLTAGMLNESIRNLIWMLQGTAKIVNSIADKNAHSSLKPKFLTGNAELSLKLSKLPWHIRRFSARLSFGLPEDVLWMDEINTIDRTFKLTRSEILSIRKHGITSPESICLGDEKSDQIRFDVFKKIKPTPHKKANWLRDSVRHWKAGFRKKTAERHLKRAKNNPIHPFLTKYYSALGDDFEIAFEELLTFLNIQFDRIDSKSVMGAPDYIVHFNNADSIVMELKTKQGSNLVSYDAAVEVLAAATVHGYKKYFCTTLCHPGVDPSVATVIASCGILSVIESCDFSEGLLRLSEGVLTQEQLFQWIATPGQALAEDLPYKEFD
ncbi:TPA: DEAD/DEAH box helicase [Yersinia enterocolitica]|nr:DEAD/DEAH box helicase [Yersinia enterocolitica]